MSATRLTLRPLEDRLTPATTGFTTAVAGPVPVTAGLIGPGLPGFSGPSANLLVGGVPDGSGRLFVPNFTQTGYGVPGTVQPLIPGFPGSVRTAVGDVTGDGTADLIAGAGPGGQLVVVYDGATTALVASFLPFESTFNGGVFVSAGDVNRDGRAEVVVTPDRTGGPRVSVYNGADLAVGNTVLIADYFGLADRAGVTDTTFRGGVRTAVGDVNGNGIPDIVVAAGFGGGPRVTIWDGGNLPPLAAGTTAVTNTTGVANATGTVSGVTNPSVAGSAALPVAGTTVQPIAGTTTVPVVGNLVIPPTAATIQPISGIAVVPPAGSATTPVAGTTTTQIAAPGSTPLAGSTVLPVAGSGVTTTVSTGLPIANFFAFEDTLRNGVFVAAGDVNGDGCADLIFGGGPGGGPRVRVVDGNSIALDTTNFSLDDGSRAGYTLANFFAGDPNARGGVRVAAKTLDGDRFADVITGSGEGQPSEVRLYRGTSILANPVGPNLDQIIDPFGAVPPDGVFVG